MCTALFLSVLLQKTVLHGSLMLLLEAWSTNSCMGGVLWPGWPLGSVGGAGLSGGGTVGVWSQKQTNSDSTRNRASSSHLSGSGCG